MVDFFCGRVGSQCGRPVVVPSSWEWQGGRLWRQPLWLWSSSLPLTRTLLLLHHPKEMHTVPPQHSLCCLRGRIEFDLHDSICRVRIFRHIYTRDRRLAGPTQLSSDTGLIPRAWGQDVGLGDKSYFSMHMSAASVHLASALTFVVQRAFIHKQLCELRCCCITGPVSQKPTTQHSHFLLPAGILCWKP